MYKFRREVISAVREKGEVFFCAPEKGNVEYWKENTDGFIPASFDRRGTNPLSDIKLYAFYKGLLEKVKPDIVFTYTVKPNVYAGMACASKGIPYIANVTGMGDALENGGLLSKVTKMLYKKGLRKAKCVFFQNKSNQEDFIKNGIVSDKTRVIPGSGVNLEGNCFEPYPEESDHVRFLFAGRLVKDKGINELIKAAATVGKKYENFTVEFIGGGSEEYKDKLNNAGERIKYSGYQSDVHPFYKKSHCIVLPSYHEGTSNVLLEAQATGRPVITTRVPGCQETFDEGITGYGCDAKSAESLADAMIRFIETPYEKRAEMGKAARKKMEQEYDRKRVIDAYLEETEKALKE